MTTNNNAAATKKRICILFSSGFFLHIGGEHQPAASIQCERLPLCFPSIRANLPYSFNCPCDDLDWTVRNVRVPRFSFSDGLACTIRHRRGCDADAVV